MSDPFTAYAKQAMSQRPAKLLGPAKTRGELRLRYDQIVRALAACSTPQDVEYVLRDQHAEITQFHAEHEFFWAGDADFLGLEHEIARAQARVDDRLDMPRREH